MSNKTTKCRIREDDNEILKIVALKLSGELQRIVTTADVIDGLFKLADGSGHKKPEQIVRNTKPHIKTDN